MSKHYGIDGIGSDVQLGKSGGRLIYDGSNYKFTLSNGSTLENVQGADPVGSTDFATKSYVDSVSAGLDPKESCQAATTGNLANYTTGGNNGQFTGVAATIDGVTLAEGDRVLVKSQTDAKQNGIYVVQATTTTLQRADDQDGSPPGNVSAGNFTFVENGTVNVNTGWVLQGDGTLTLNTDNLDWALFSASGDIIAGNGLVKNGNALDLDFSELTDMTGGISAGTEFILQDGTTESRKAASEIDLSILDNSTSQFSTTTGVVETITAGTGIIGTGTAADVSLALDFSELTSASVIALADELIFQDGGVESRITVQNFVNDRDIPYGITSDGIITRTANDTYASRTITASAVAGDEGISVVNGDGVAGNPTIGIDIVGQTNLVTDSIDDADELLLYHSVAAGTEVVGNYAVTAAKLKSYMNAGTSASSITEGDSTLAVSDTGADGTLTWTADSTQVFTVTDTTFAFENGLDLTLATGGTITVTDLTENDVMIVGASGLIEDSGGNFTFDGSVLALTGAMDITGDLDVDNINIDGNTISSSDVNGDIILAPNGSGAVVTDVIEGPSVTALNLSGGASSSGTAAGNLLLNGGDNSSTGTAGNVVIRAGSSTSGTDGRTIIQDEAGNEIMEFLNGTSAVNHISLLPGATGIAPTISTNVSGADANVDLNFTLKGTGVLAVTAGTGNYEDNVTADDDIPNKKYVDDAVSNVTGGIGSSSGTVDFTSATAQSIGTLPANAVVLKVTMNVDTGSDAATTCTVGDATNGAASYMAASENDPESVDVYIAEGYLANGAGDRTIQATVATAGTTGSATVIVEWRTS